MYLGVSKNGCLLEKEGIPIGIWRGYLPGKGFIYGRNLTNKETMILARPISDLESRLPHLLFNNVFSRQVGHFQG